MLQHQYIMHRHIDTQFISLNMRFETQQMADHSFAFPHSYTLYCTISCLLYPTTQCLLSQVFLYSRSLLSFPFSLGSKKAMIPQDIYIIKCRQKRQTLLLQISNIAVSLVQYILASSPSFSAITQQKIIQPKCRRSTQERWVLALFGILHYFSCFFSLVQVI